jgi:hypothetical protein
MSKGKIAIVLTVAASLAATAIVTLPVQAGTCVPVTAKGRAGDPAAATTQAAIKLTQRAAAIGGKIKNRSTDCKKGPPGGFVCITSAVVCPQR